MIPRCRSGCSGEPVHVLLCVGEATETNICYKLVYNQRGGVGGGDEKTLEGERYRRRAPFHQHPRGRGRVL